MTGHVNRTLLQSVELLKELVAREDVFLRLVGENWDRVHSRVVTALEQASRLDSDVLIRRVDAILDEILAGPGAVEARTLLTNVGAAIDEICTRLDRANVEKPASGVAGDPQRGVDVSPLFEMVPVYYATDRGRATGDAVDYTAERGSLSYGRAFVSVPRNHRKGQIERPRWWKLQFRERPSKHFVVMDVQEMPSGEFVRAMQTAVRTTARREGLVFVHGYNVRFRDGIRRLAQLVYDLDFAGPGVLYSWPSQGSALKYTVDENNIAWTAEHLKFFLAQLRTQVALDAVHVIAHSMGCRASIDCLRDVATSAEQSAPLRQVVLAAPDFDADTFRQIARKFRACADRTTIYASTNDEALKTSKLIHGHPRLGDSGAGLVVIEDLDTIDASAVDTSLLGHSYYGDNRTILTDLFTLLRHGHAPDDRPDLQRLDRDGRPYWAFRA